ncbi:hypothetical protein JQN72_16140 [Phycicoccus sp. CSK15P-2]|uniref:HAD domain-containing protein n=1 Tax=Phycicoccus sp. CSK15P-2 TaxID=2807627 RepID=UPI00194F6862|nr:HAD domain-containing protein [Phycicoccus sp. CSK15P-2]MBM6405774.1 hypothetical protein [Phycicoccus sp. CSK15P-2]
MYGRPGRPLLFLDVDGTLIPTAGVRMPSRLGDWNTSWQTPSNPHLTGIAASHGARLLQMDCEIVWASAWMHDADKVIAPILGLPQLPVAELGDLPPADGPTWTEEDPSAGLNWKTRALVRLAADRPFAWVDDELTDVDRAWVSANHSAPALLRRVDSRCGLTATDMAALEDWLSSL